MDGSDTADAPTTAPGFERAGRGCAVVTGMTSGFGRAVAQFLAAEGHDLVLVGRDADRAAEVQSELARSSCHRVLVADLSSIVAVREVVEGILAVDRPVDLLVNNAGAVYGLRRRCSVDGIELTMALNHLAYFQLTVGLLGPLEAGRGRVVNVASDAYSFAGGRFDFDTWQGEHHYRPHRQYGRSKLANILFTRELDRRHRADGIETMAWSPAGLTATRFAYGANPLAPAIMKLTHPFAAKTDDAVAPLLALLSEADLGPRRGSFVCGADDHPVEPSTDDDARHLWLLSEQVIAAHLPTRTGGPGCRHSGSRTAGST